MKRLCFEEVSPGVVTTRIYSPRHCASILSRVRTLHGWSKAQVRLETSNGTHRVLTKASARSASILTSCAGIEICNNFESRVKRFIRPLIKEVWQIDLKEISGTQLIRYRLGGYYVEHTDAGDDLAERYFSIVCYLNDNFKGGHTSFPSFQSSISPSSGKTLIFPSRYLHRADPILSAEKYVLITWMCGPVAIRWI
jgi:hypothetical protein